MRPLLEALVVQHEPLYNHFFQYRSRPDAELGRLVTVHSVADGDNGVEIIQHLRAGYLTFTFVLNYSNFSNSCRFRELSASINFLEMVVYRVDFHPVQFRHTLLRHPERVAVENNLDARFPLGRLVQQNA